MQAKRVKLPKTIQTIDKLTEYLDKHSMLRDIEESLSKVDTVIIVTLSRDKATMNVRPYNVFNDFEAIGILSSAIDIMKIDDAFGGLEDEEE